MALLDAIQVPLAKLSSEYYVFGAAGLLSLLAFGGLILSPALSSFSRPWEKFAAGLLSVFVLAALVIVGLVIGLLVVYNWDTISEKL